MKPPEGPSRPPPGHQVVLLRIGMTLTQTGSASKSTWTILDFRCGQVVLSPFRFKTQDSDVIVKSIADLTDGNAYSVHWPKNNNGKTSANDQNDGRKARCEFSGPNFFFTCKRSPRKSQSLVEKEVQNTQFAGDPTKWMPIPMCKCGATGEEGVPLTMVKLRPFKVEMFRMLADDGSIMDEDDELPGCIFCGEGKKLSRHLPSFNEHIKIIQAHGDAKARYDRHCNSKHPSMALPHHFKHITQYRAAEMQFRARVPSNTI